jgi:hypothetical protein
MTLLVVTGAKIVVQHSLISIGTEPPLSPWLTIYRPPGRRLAGRGDLQPADHRSSLSVGYGRLADRRAAPGPDLHPA